MFYVTGVEGIPFFLRLAGSTFNASGAWNLQGSYDTSLGGITIDLQSFSLTGGKVEVSNVFPMFFN